MISKKIVAIDIGSSKISCLVVRHNFEKDIKILGSYTSQSAGISNGIITNISLLEKSILLAIRNTEKIINDSISKVSINISGKDLDYKIAEVSISLSMKPVSKKDVKNLISSITIDVNNSKIIHIVPISYSIDNITGIRNPIGMIGEVLKLTATIIYTNKSLYKNLILAFESCNLKVEKVVADPYAAGLGSLTEDEAKLGTALIDIGSSTSSIAFFKNSSIHFIKSIPIGGINITKDIAYAFDIDFNSAERLKILYGSATRYISNAKEFVLVPSRENKNLVNLKQVQKSEIFDVIEPRVFEILELLNHYINIINPSSIVLTGGTSMLTGIIDVAEQIFKRKIRHQKPSEGYSISTLGIINSVYNDENISHKTKVKKNHQNTNFMRVVFEWLKENF